jgi:hypothetical protein
LLNGHSFVLYSFLGVNGVDFIVPEAEAAAIMLLCPQNLPE